MNPCLILIYLTSLALAVLALGGEPRTVRTEFDAERRFNVEAAIPEGSRQAVLEISTDLGASATWRKMIGAAIDGREAHVTFRLPPQSGNRLFARVRTADSITLPPLELNDPALCTVEYVPSNGSQAQIDFLSSAAVKMREWSELPRPESQANLIAWALQNPLVASAEVSPVADNVSLRFTDGTIAVLLNEPRFSDAPPEPYTPTAGFATAASSFAAKVPRLAGPSNSLPGSDLAITAFSLENHFPNSAPTINGWLSSANYATSHFTTPTVAEVMGWSAGKPIGVLFWQTHGCSYKKSDGTEGIGLVTRQFATKGQYSAMIRSGELGLAIGKKQTVPFYTINDSFVRNHLRFAPNSIVVLDACFGASAELAKGFIDVGAGSFASYDWLSGNYSGTPCLKVFDRLLGMNQEPPISGPKERPFSLPAVNWWMDVRGYYYDPSPKYPNQDRSNAKLTWYHHATAPGYILKPSVMRVLSEAAYENERYTKFLIEGDFGRDPGPSKREVEWGGAKMQVVRWEPETGITIRMPAAPPVGAIQVLMHENFSASSNFVPITQWTVPFKYEVQAEGSKHATLEMNVKFRADIHGSRGVPEMPVQYLSTVFSNMADCTGSASGTGSHNPSSNVTVSWSGGSSLTSVDTNSPDNDGTLERRIWNFGTIDAARSKINPFGLSAAGDFTETIRTVHPNGSVTTETHPSGVGFGYPAPEMLINFGTAALRGNTLTWPGNEGSAKLSWPTVTPQMVPDQNTPR